ncbi:putative nucleotidyltransferase [Actinoplanes lutulentus]|nr:nucleotidyltransferase domain-containing protein [Actinoplanes lutulentus]MBB2948575.1 putative nucleotidyltransferase [Actinoplanes lutulentus]
MTDQVDALQLPPSLSSEHRDVLADLVRRNEADYGENIVGLVLSGSAGRGMATEKSDLDVFTVLADTGGRGPQTSRSAALDETIVAISDLERVPSFGTEGWWYRWSFAWAPVLLDRTEGRSASALHRQATVTADEAASILVKHDRLDGWLNFAYRALKNDRDGRSLERRLDAAESVPWLLDVIFTLEGRVRPYHKYLPWELRQHPLTLWRAEELLALLTATLDGDPSAIRATFQRVETSCAAFDSQVAIPVLTPVIESWGDELQILRD